MKLDEQSYNERLLAAQRRRMERLGKASAMKYEQALKRAEVERKHVLQEAMKELVQVAQLGDLLVSTRATMPRQARRFHVVNSHCGMRSPGEEMTVQEALDRGLQCCWSNECRRAYNDWVAKREGWTPPRT